MLVKANANEPNSDYPAKSDLLALLNFTILCEYQLKMR